MRGRCGWIVVGCLALVATACTEQRLDDSLMDQVTTTSSTIFDTPLLPGQTTAPPGAQPALEAKISAVDTGSLQIGEEFNRQFLSVQFLAIGLTATEAQCAVDAIAKTAGAEFATRAVSQVASAGGIGPDVLLPCVPVQRMTALASGGAAPDFSRVPVAQLRATFAQLAAGGYRSVGLTDGEASCLADAVMASYTDEQLTKLTTSIELGGSATSGAIPHCVTPERVRDVVRS